MLCVVLLYFVLLCSSIVEMNTIEALDLTSLNLQDPKGFQNIDGFEGFSALCFPVTLISTMS